MISIEEAIEEARVAHVRMVVARQRWAIVRQHEQELGKQLEYSRDHAAKLAARAQMMVRLHTDARIDGRSRS